MDTPTVALVSIDQLRDVVASELRAALAALVTATPNERRDTIPVEFLTRSEAARLLRVSLVTLTSLTNREVLPVHRLPGLRRPLYLKSDVLAALETRSAR